MSSVNFLEKLLDEVTVLWKPLGTIAQIKRGSPITKKQVIDGDVPVIAGGRTPAYYHNVSNRNGETIVIAGSGAYAGYVSWWEQPIFVSDAFTVTTNDSILQKYCFYWLQSLQTKLHDFQSGSGVPHVYPRDVALLEIPIPCPDNPKKSLEIQAEIVRILDAMTAHTAELTAELTARKKQYNYYRDKLLSFEDGEVEWKALGEIGEFIRGKRFTKEDYVKTGIPSIHYGEIYTSYGSSADRTFSQVNVALENRLRYAVNGDVIIAGVGETVEDVGKSVAWLGINKVAFHDDSYVFRHKINPKYISYFMQTDSFHLQKKKFVSSGKVKRLIIDGLKSNVKIPIPFSYDMDKSLAEQARIVNLLERFEKIISSVTDGLPREIELRQKQYAYYRDLLLSFPQAQTA